MFPLSCAHVHTGHEASAQKKTWSAQKCLVQNTGDETSAHKKLLERTKEMLWAHRLKKIRGNTRNIAPESGFQSSC